MESIEHFALANEPMLRLGAFSSIFVAMMLFERLAPRRVLTLPRVGRWTHNLALFGLNSLVLRLIFPAAAVGLAQLAIERGWGFFNHVEWAYGVEILLAVLLLDLAIYWQHRLMHVWAPLWRLHRVHHADLDFDLTTAQRFHTIEILLSMVFKGCVIVVLGPSLLAVLVFEIVLNGMATFNHANVRLPEAADRMLRRLVVTPDMHRVHHSVVQRETDSNYGFNLSLWDRLFGSYTDQPEAGHVGMTIGIADFRKIDQVERLPGMLAMPFVSHQEEASSET